MSIIGQQTTTKLQAASISGTIVSIEYDTLSGNMPNSYGNSVTLWQNSNTIPWNQKHPLKTQSIPGDTKDGSFEFTGLELTENSYIIGYSVGTDVGNICSTIFIPQNSSECIVFNPSVDIFYRGTDSIIVSYKLPTGSTPKTYKHWLGMWEGVAASYSTPPIKFQQITNENADDNQAINDVKFLRGKTYTIAYFSGGYIEDKPIQTTMACTVSFSV
jgi:hypothetical protein